MAVKVCQYISANIDYQLRGQNGFQASVRPSPHRDHVAQGSLVTGVTENVGPNSIILSDQREALTIVNVSRMISSPRHKNKAIFEINQQGTRYIAKCWGPGHERE